MKTKALVYFFIVSALLGIFCTQDLHSRPISQDEQLIRVGVGAFNDRFYDIAEKQFLQFIKDYPNHEKIDEVCYLLGKTLFFRNNLKESRTIFLKIMNEHKNFKYADYTAYWLSEIEIRLGHGDEARKHLLSIVKRFPKFEWIDYAYYLLGLLDFEFNRFPQAEDSFKKVPLSSKNQDLIQSSLYWLGLSSFKQKEYQDAIHYFRTLWEDPTFLPTGSLRYALFWLGESQLRLGRFHDAKTTFRTFSEGLKNDPLLPEVLWRLGFCEYRSGNLKESIEIFQTLKNQMKDSPLLLYTHYLLGKIFFINRNYPASIKELNTMINRLPGNSLTGISFLTLFWNYIQLGEMDGANKIFQRLQKMNYFEDEKTFIQWLNAELIFSEGRVSDSLPYYFNILNSKFREKALYQIGRGYFFDNKSREAITNLDILLLEFPNSKFAEESLFMKAESLNRLGNLDQALDAYELIIKQPRNHPWEIYALTQTGNLHMARNENNKAQKAFKKILEEFPYHPLYYNAACQLGNLNFRKNNIGDAIHYFSIVLKGNILQLFGEAYFSLGEIFYQQGKYDKALTSFEAAIQYLKETSLWFFLTQLEIGNLHRKWGRYEEAKKAYTIIVDHSKDKEIKEAARILLNQVGSP
jgi:TolA-binding protein